MSVLTDKLDPALALYADLILHPAFPEADFARVKKQMLAGIAQEKASPHAMGLRVLTRLLYGEGHAYANPLTGSGTVESVKPDHPRGSDQVSPGLVQAEQRHA